MADTVASALLDSCWHVLCQLTQAVKTYPEPLLFCSLSLGIDEQVQLNVELEAPSEGCFAVTLIVDPGNPRLPVNIGRDGACFEIQELAQMTELGSGTLPADVRQMINAYAPYCFAPVYAKSWQRAFAVSHFAQSLDGRIATAGGHSQWIGGPGNLTHAHRMRALCDGILIGAKTLDRDRPRLTVRHVPGRNPARIVIASSSDQADCLVQADGDPVLLLSTRELVPPSGVDVITLPSDNGHLSSLQILQALYKRGIDSVYIEGGSMTTSCFLQEGYLDVVQLHIAPMIIGSGESAFCLPEIAKISDSLRFASHSYLAVDDGMMFVGALRHPTH